MLLMIGGFALFLLILFLFSSQKLSPVPYFPSHSEDIPSILKLMQLKNNQVVLDLGAGGGFVIFKAAELSLHKKINTEFIAVENNPVLLAILWIKRLFHPNRRRVHIAANNLFTTNYKHLISTSLNKKKYIPLFYFYTTPWLVEKTVSQITKTVVPVDIISYFYPLKMRAVKHIRQKNNIYLYTIKK